MNTPPPILDQARADFDQERVDYFFRKMQHLQRQLVHHKGRHEPKSTAAELAKYAKYRASPKGQARTCRYNHGNAAREAQARYRDTIGYWKRLLARRRASIRLRMELLKKEATEYERAALTDLFRRRRSPGQRFGSIWKKFVKK